PARGPRRRHHGRGGGGAKGGEKLVPGLLRPSACQLDDSLEKGRESRAWVLQAPGGHDAFYPRPVLLPESPAECLLVLGKAPCPALPRQDTGIGALHPGLGANPF